MRWLCLLHLLTQSYIFNESLLKGGFVWIFGMKKKREFCLRKSDSKAKTPMTPPVIQINSSICGIVSCKLSLKVCSADQRRAPFAADGVGRCLNCHFSSKCTAPTAIIGSWKAFTREKEPNKKSCVSDSKGWRKGGLHLSLFKNDYSVTIPPKLKWSLFSLKVNVAGVGFATRIFGLPILIC